MKKRILSICLSLALLSSLLPVGSPTATAEGSTMVTYPLEGGNLYFDTATGTITDCDATVTVANIPTEIEGVAVTKIGSDAFYSCDALTSIALPSTITYIAMYYRAAFYGCGSLSEIIVDSENEEYASKDGVLFSKDMTSLLRYPEGKQDSTYCIPETVDYIIEQAFVSCGLLKNVVIPESVDVIESDTFYYCELDCLTFLNPLIRISRGSSLGPHSTALGNRGATLHGYDVSLGGNGIEVSVKDFTESYRFTFEAHSFENGICAVCNAKAVTEGSITENASWSFDWENKDLKITGTGEISYSDVQEYPWHDFKTCIETVNIENGITTIGDSAFNGCSNLTKIDIPESVESIGHGAFYDTACYYDDWQDGELYIDHWLIAVGFAKSGEYMIKPGTVGIADRALMNCKDITAIVLPESLKYIGYGAVMQCDNLTEINIPNSVTSIGSKAFYFCESLTSITIPESVITIGDEAFTVCDALMGIYVSEDNTAYASEDGVLFNKDKTILIQYPAGKTETVYTIPNSVATIGNFAFYDCASLVEVTIPSGVTTIGNSAFVNCDGLTEVTIPNNVITIGDLAFFSCDNLTAVYLYGDAPELGEDVFYTYNEGFVNILNLVLYYIDGKEGWTTPTWNGYPTATWMPEHECSYTAVVTAPTCTDKGCTTYTCACGSSYKAEYTDALGHDYKEGVCTRCGQADPNYMPVIPTNNFKDISEGAYYYAPVLWAVQNGVTTGTSSTTFSPEDVCTRGQIVTFLWRAMGKPEPASKSNPFSDVKTTDYYYKAVLWAVEQGITTGTGNGKFSPNAACTRAQVATFLWRAYGEPAASGSNPFKDVNSSNYYYEAVLWAVENGVTTGTGNGKFSPDDSCTRGQIVTFLYRAMKED